MTEFTRNELSIMRQCVQIDLSSLEIQLQTYC